MTKTAPRSRFGSFVYTVAMRVASGGTSAPTAMACRQRPSVARLSPSRENRLCASGAAARLAVFTEVPTHTNPRRAVKYVDFATVWGQGHTMPERTGSGTANFIEWVRGCCA